MTTKQLKHPYLWLGLVATGVLLLDQFTKWVITQQLHLYSHIPVIEPFFYWVHTRNTGAAWSIFSNHTESLILLGIIVLVVLFWFRKTLEMTQGRSPIIWGMFVGGLLGNWVDRALNGYVIDFIYLQAMGYGFPAFNVADIAICLSVAALILKEFYKPKTFNSLT